MKSYHSLSQYKMAETSRTYNIIRMYKDFMYCSVTFYILLIALLKMINLGHCLYGYEKKSFFYKVNLSYIGTNFSIAYFSASGFSS